MGRCKESLREEVTRAFKGSGSLDPLLALHEARPRGRAFSVRRRQTLNSLPPSLPASEIPPWCPTLSGDLDLDRPLSEAITPLGVGETWLRRPRRDSAGERSALGQRCLDDLDTLRKGERGYVGSLFQTQEGIMQGTCSQGLDTSFVALGYGKVAVLGRRARHHRVDADFVDRAHAHRAGASRLAGPGLCILGNDAVGRIGSGRELLLGGR